MTDKKKTKKKGEMEKNKVEPENLILPQNMILAGQRIFKDYHFFLFQSKPKRRYDRQEEDVEEVGNGKEYLSCFLNCIWSLL